MGRLIGTAHIICLYIDQVTFTPEKRVGGGISVFCRGVLSITDFCKNSQKPETKTKGIRTTTSKRMAIGFAFAFWGAFFNKHLYSRGQKNLNDFEIIFKPFYILCKHLNLKLK